VERAVPVPQEVELICVDDGSRDGSREILAEVQRQYPNLRILRQPKNVGKRAALRRGIQEATGDYVLIQDADLEYDPDDYPNLLEPLIQNKADVVYGSRFLGSGLQEIRSNLHLKTSRRLFHGNFILWKTLRPRFCYTMRAAS